MTRKCALCKETNYKKNNCSFFSAPKDAETRKKWQIALQTYTVTDDTYVCSRHFHKNDIITHWVSGVPPQVIKIKYKKCRLRPGAVPGRNLHLVSDLQSVDKEDALDRCKVVAKNLSIFKKKQTSKENKTILSSERENNLNDNEDACNKATNVCYHIKSKPQDCEENDESKNIRILEDISVSRHSSQLKKSRSMKKEPIEILECNNNPANETVECNIKKYNSSKKYSAYFCLKNKAVNALKTTNDLKTTSKINENEILFEDFLEVYTEVSIPRGWSCLVTSKGHGTTVVYLCMSITTDGLPFVEKQVFIKSDMILRYAVANREIDPLIHNLVTERKFTKVRNLVDIEILIDEFNQRVVCQGIYNPVDHEDNNIIKVVHKDGIKWRHIFCPLIMNNDLSRCTKCTILSRMLLQKS